MEGLIVTILFFLVKVNVLKTDRFKLDIDPIAPVYWVDNQNIFVNEQSKSYIYDVVKREVVEEYEREENQILGYEKETLFNCFWENRSIDSPDEYSTHLIVDKGSDVMLLDVELKPTVEVVECSKSPLLKTVFPIEEKYFVFDEELYGVENYQMDVLSSRFNRLLNRDGVGNYWVTEFRINL